MVTINIGNVNPRRRRASRRYQSSRPRGYSTFGRYEAKSGYDETPDTGLGGDPWDSTKWSWNPTNQPGGYYQVGDTWYMLPSSGTMPSGIHESSMSAALME